ncbi:hypothetical protein HU200_033011 [Digitaria exilis]|uniref:KIB1-4 beta-propeller domain-containing protein n=1 Tax=Digitaria exilis TaxID=1010633 RepID=A0A835ERN6_9POAL|nr:hypothetical protein HU200_033011 [Digitaria exilis]
MFFSFLDKKAIGIEGELTNNNCWATPQGWILVRDASSSTTYLLDPHIHTDRRRIPLPHLLQENQSTYCTCRLSEYPDPAHPNCCIVLLIETDAPIIWYCRIGDTEWTRHEYDIGTLDLPDLGEGYSEKIVISPVTACQGKFYFNGSYKELCTLEFSPAPVFGYRKVFMVESKQELYMVCFLVDRITVHKMDFSKQEWCEVDDIGGQVFLLSSWCFGASRSADECRLEPNCVYMIYPWNKRLIIFSLAGGTTKVHDLEEMTASDQALWMLPTHP